MADQGEQEHLEEGYEQEGYEEEIPVDGAQQGGEQEALDEMKRKLKELEDEAIRLKQAVQAGDAGPSGSAGAAGASDANKEEVDSRSIFVGSVDYQVTPEELQQHFQSCGTVNRVTILTDKFGNPKGYAYVEFLEVDAVSNAMLLDNTELKGRNIKVMQKRTNVPGLKVRGRGRGRGGYMGRGVMPMMPYGMPMMPMPMMFAGRGRGAYGGFAPRGRGRGRGYYPY